MMQSTVKCLFLALTVLASACSPGSHGNENSNSPVEASTENPTDVAERLVDEGERAFTFQSISLAQDKFHAAIAKDPENPRARFWVAMSDLFFQFRGILTRAQPYYGTMPGGADRYEDARNRYENSLTSVNPAYRFLIEGPQDIHTSIELVEWIDQLRSTISNARQTMHDIRDSEFTITVPKLVSTFGTNLGGRQTGCEMLNFGPIKFQIAESFCSGDGPISFGLNAGDFDQIGMVLTYFQVYLDLLTAYRFNPTQLIANLSHPIRDRADAERFMNAVFSGEDGHGNKYDGGLRRPQPFISLKQIAGQSILALKYQQQNQATLCPLGYSSPGNRRGYLFSAGSCLAVNDTKSDRERSIDTFEAILNGVPVPAQDGTSEINFTELAVRPPDSLREMVKLKFNACGKISGINTEAYPAVFRRFDDAAIFRVKPCALDYKVRAR